MSAGICVSGIPPKGDFLLDQIIAVGFGVVHVTRGGEVVYDESEVDRKHLADKGNDCEEWPPYWTGHDAENEAAKDPDHVWEILIYGPLSNGRWQRAAPGIWSLIDSGKGFA